MDAGRDAGRKTGRKAGMVEVEEVLGEQARSPNLDAVSDAMHVQVPTSLVTFQVKEMMDPRNDELHRWSRPSCRPPLSRRRVWF
eukprot:958652-Rhodomonas_salina.3